MSTDDSTIPSAVSGLFPPTGASRFFDNLDNLQVNPQQDYWFCRSDGNNPEVRHEFGWENCYLRIEIPIIRKKGLLGPLLYTNAEIYNGTKAMGAPRNVVKNPHLVDDLSAKGEIHNFIEDIYINLPYQAASGLNLYCEAMAEGLGGGSRGWGFWNTNPVLEEQSIAWFFQYDSSDKNGKKSSLEGMWAWCQRGCNVVMKKLDFGGLADFGGMDEKWHSYRIRMNGRQALFFVDERLVFLVDDPTCIPNCPMAFHNWVDNAVYEPNILQFLKHHGAETKAPRANIMRNLAIQWNLG